MRFVLLLLSLLFVNYFYAFHVVSTVVNEDVTSNSSKDVRITCRKSLNGRWEYRCRCYLRRCRQTHQSATAAVAEHDDASQHGPRLNSAHYFASIYNQCGIMDAGSRKMLKLFWDIFAFLKKRPLTVKFTKFCFESFYCLTDGRVVFKFREIWLSGNRLLRALLTWQKNKISPGSAAVATARIAPKICQGQPPQCTQSALDFVQIGSLSVELYVNTAKTRRKVNAILGWSLASSRIIKYKI